MEMEIQDMLCHIRIIATGNNYYVDDYGEPIELDEVPVTIQFLDGPFRGAMVDVEVDKDDIDKKYLTGE